MLTLSEISSRLRDYFTLKDNDITCDYCTDSYDIILNNEVVRNHLKETHEEYENAVTSKSTQEKLKEFYTIHNNNIKCNRCDKLYISWNSHSIIKYHLEYGHGTDEVKVKGMRRWICEKYQLNESDGIQYCKSCQMGIENKPVKLIRHLADKHDDVSYLKYKPTFVRKRNKLDNLFENWIWNYFSRKGEYAQCSVCNKDYKYLRRRWDKMDTHMKKEHGKPLVPLSRLKDKSKWKYCSLIQQDLVNCDLCDTTVETLSNINSYVLNHLEVDHQITNFTEIWRNWVFEKIDKLAGFQKSYCKHCDTKLEQMCPFSLFLHLRDGHEMEMSFGMSIMEESSSSGSMHLGSHINVEDTSSGHPKAGSSKDSDTEVRDVDHDRDSRKELKRKLSSLSSSDKNVKPIATTSTVPQAGSSKDVDTDDRDSGMKKVKHDDDKRPLTDWKDNFGKFEGLDVETSDDLNFNYNEDSDDSDTIDTLKK